MRHHRSLTPLAILCVSAALVALTSGPGAGAGPSSSPAGGAPVTLPPGATGIAVTEGSTTTAIDAHLTPASSISGRLRTSSGAPLSGVVSAYRDGKLAGTTVASSGHYTIPGLSAASYAVCADRTWASRGSGYLGRCWKTAPFYGKVPAGASLVTLADSEQRTGVDLALPPAAAISGTVTTPGGIGLDNADVFVHNLSTGKNYGDLTRAGGVYSVKGLGPSAKGYRVCFAPPAGGTGTGYLRQCYLNKPWSGGAYPTSVTAVSVKAGTFHLKVDQTLPPGGAVAGSVTDAATSAGVRGAPVSLFSARGRLLASTRTSSTGRYRLIGLSAASGDRVCVNPYRRSATLGYRGVCWKRATWNGGAVPSGAAPVSVRTSATHTHVDLRLRRAANGTSSISGTVTQQSDATPVERAFVYLFRNGTQVAGTDTDASGHYTFAHLVAATGLTICVNPFNTVAPAPPDTGWAPRCYGDVPWNGLQVPSSATKIALGAGQDLAAVDVALRAGGTVQGTVLDLDGITPVPDVTVDVFTTAGGFVTFATTAPDGTYQVRELSAADYVVCFDGRSLFVTGDYAPQCYDSVPWNPPPLDG